MKFTADRKSLAKALAVVAKAIPGNVVNPVVGRVRLDASTESGTVALTGTGPEATVCLLVPATVQEDGQSLMSMEAVKWVQACRSDSVHLTDDGLLNLTDDGGNEYAATAALAANTFPVPELTEGVRVSLSAALVSNILSPVLLAADGWADEKNQRFYRPAVAVWAADGMLRAGATDRTVFAIAGECRQPVATAVIPLEAAKVMADLVDGRDDGVSVEFLPDNRGVRLTFASGWVQCPLADSKPPPVDTVLKSVAPLPNRYVVNAHQFASAVKSAAVSMDRKKAQMDVSVADGRMTVVGMGDGQMTTARLPCDGYCQTFSMAGDYLVKMSKAMADGCDAELGVSLAVDAAKPDYIGLMSGVATYAMRALTEREVK